MSLSPSQASEPSRSPRRFEIKLVDLMKRFSHPEIWEEMPEIPEKTEPRMEIDLTKMKRKKCPDAWISGHECDDSCQAFLEAVAYSSPSRSPERRPVKAMLATQRLTSTKEAASVRPPSQCPDAWIPKHVCDEICSLLVDNSES